MWPDVFEQAAKEGYAAERAARHAQAAKEREERARQQEAKQAAKEAAKAAKKADDALSDFLSSLGGDKQEEGPGVKAATAAEAKGTSACSSAEGTTPYLCLSFVGLLALSQCSVCLVVS